jgi:5-(carboxyamino)imidazole ribonucleotide mutase
MFNHKEKRIVLMSKVSVIMGSASDISVARKITETLAEYSVDFDVKVLSAHRTPLEAAEYVKGSESDVFIAVAGMAAHLAGAVAANTIKPVIAVPVWGKTASGLDSLLSSVMMPPGVPVATVAVDGGKNAAMLAVQILAVSDNVLSDKLYLDKESMRQTVLASDEDVRTELMK